jgi:ATP-binding cassette subfamily B protein
VALFLKKRKEFDYKLFDRSSKKQTLLIQLISGIRDIKLHNYENQKRWQWEQVQVQNFKISVRQLMMQQYQQVGAIIIDTTKNILISFMSAKAVIDGEITLGMMFSIQYIIGQLNSPVSLLIGFINSYQDARISLERIGEIHRNEDEAKAVNEFGFRTLPADKTLRFENFSFDYDGPNSPKVLKNINLEIPFGKTTAIVGASGSGKTTILKLLLKFYTRYEGRIKLGNQDLKDINHKAWRESCGVVLQDGFLFSESIASNIALGDENISLEKLDFACDVANITDFVRGLPLGYNTMIGNDGVGISQGQRQRILIARAVYKNPEFIFFDEATNSLDTNNERVIVHNLERFFRGKTVVVVAHRLSTVKNADQIVVLEKGEIAEIGTHDGLIENRSYYFSLIKNQLELSH